MDSPGPLEFWAKTLADGRPGLSVRDHGLNVGCVAEALIAALPATVRDLLPPGAVTLAALHDVGKITVGFLSKCDRWLVAHALSARSTKENWRQTSESNHGKVSAWVLRNWLQGRWPDADLDKLAHAIGAHHGALFGAQFLRMERN